MFKRYSSKTENLLQFYLISLHQIDMSSQFLPVTQSKRFTFSTEDQVVQLPIHAMLIRYFYIRSSKRSESNTEIQSSNIFRSDIRPSLEEHGFFKYLLGIFEIFEKQISMFNAYFQKKKTTFFMMMIIFLPRLLSSHAA